MYSLLGEIALKVLSDSVIATRNLDGDMAEFGVYKGGSAKIISKSNPNKLLHLFDTFSCQPFDDLIVNGFKSGDFNTNLSDVKNNLRDCLVEYHVGIFQDIELPDIKYSFIYLDSDLYQNIVAGINYFYPRLVTNGIIVFDDFCNINCNGVKRALEESDLINYVIKTDEYTQCKLVKTDNVKFKQISTSHLIWSRFPPSLL